MNTLVIALTLAASLTTSIATRPEPTRATLRAIPARPVQQKVWLTEDVEALRNRGLISIVGEEALEEPVVVEEMAPTSTPRLPKEQDPEWYLERLAEPRKELAEVEAKLASLRRNLTCSCTPEGGINLDRSNTGITPDSGVWLLERQARELRSEISSIEDEALRCGLAPGIFR